MPLMSIIVYNNQNPNDGFEFLSFNEMKILLKKVQELILGSKKKKDY